MTRMKAAEAHIYDDFDVTPARLTKFALADRPEQVAVLAKLRERSIDDSTAITMGFSSLVIAIFLVIAAPLLTVGPDPAVSTSWIAKLVVMVVIVLVILVVVAPALYGAAKDQVRKQRAVVWLGAYEDELARRHRLRGVEARRWKREH